MEKFNDWNEINEEGNSGLSLKPNYYAITILKAIDHPEEKYLEFFFDIICDKNKDKTFNNYFKNYYDKFKGNWKGTMRSYYGSDGAKSFFKRNIRAIEKSNDGYDFAEHNFDETTLKGKKCYGTFQEVEYINKDDEVKTIVQCRSFHSFTAVANGDAKDTEWQKVVTLEDQGKERPKEKTYEEVKQEIDDDDLPF